MDQLLDSLLATQGSSSEGSSSGGTSSTSSSGGSGATAAEGAAAAAAPALAAPKSREEVLSALAEDISRRLAQPFDIEAARYKWVERLGLLGARAKG